MQKMGLKPIIFLINNAGYTIEKYIHGQKAKYNDITNWYVLSRVARMGVSVTRTLNADPLLEYLQQEMDAPPSDARRRRRRDMSVVQGRNEEGAVTITRQ